MKIKERKEENIFFLEKKRKEKKWNIEK